MSVPYPSEECQIYKKWIICEWDGDKDDQSLDAIVQEGVSFDSLKESTPFVKQEVMRFYDEIAEDTVSLDEYATGPTNSNEPNIIYDLPTEEEAGSRVLLCMATNGILTFGLSAWKNGHNPNFMD